MIKAFPVLPKHASHFLQSDVINIGNRFDAVHVRLVFGIGYTCCEVSMSYAHVLKFGCRMHMFLSKEIKVPKSYILAQKKSVIMLTKIRDM